MPWLRWIFKLSMLKRALLRSSKGPLVANCPGGARLAVDGWQSKRVQGGLRSCPCTREARTCSLRHETERAPRAQGDGQMARMTLHRALEFDRKASKNTIYMFWHLTHKRTNTRPTRCARPALVTPVFLPFISLSLVSVSRHGQRHINST